MLVLFTAPPKELELRYEGVTRRVPPPADSIFLIPAGSPVRVRTRNAKDQLHIFLAPEVLARVAAEAFDLDPARLSVCPLDGVDLPHLRATMRAVDAEMTAGAGGERLAAESLANILAVQPFFNPTVAPDTIDGARRFAHSIGQLTAPLPYEQVVATQFQHLWTASP